MDIKPKQKTVLFYYHTSPRNFHRFSALMGNYPFPHENYQIKNFLPVPKSFILNSEGKNLKRKNKKITKRCHQ
jgi:hypothetical protein